MRSTLRFTVARLAATLVVGVLVAACAGDSTTGAGSGTIAVQLTDAPPAITDSLGSVNVFVVRVDGRIAAADSAAAAAGAPDDSAGTGGWITLATPNAVVNLLAYQNGAALPLGNATLAAGSYSGFRLVIDPTKSSVTLANGTTLTGTSNPGVMFPSASRSGIKIVLTQPVTVVAHDTTTMLVDFMVDSSFVVRGSSISQNGLLFKPVVHATVK